MEIAIWIIAIIEVIRMVQNFVQLLIVSRDGRKEQMKIATEAFVKSLSNTDKVFVEQVLKEFEEERNGKTEEE